MSAFAWLVAEWRERRAWRKHGGIFLSLLVVSIASVFPWLQAFALSLALPASALCLGWASGSRFKPGQRLRKLLLGSGIDPRKGGLGRALESTAEALFHALLLSPPALLALILWQRPLACGLLLALSFIAAFVLSAGAGYLSSLLLGQTDRLLSLYFFGIWVLPTTLIKRGHPFSPFFQSWDALGHSSPNVAPALLGTALEIAIAAALYSAGASAIALARRRDAA